jgi:hypothetical protein
MSYKSSNNTHWTVHKQGADGFAAVLVGGDKEVTLQTRGASEAGAEAAEMAYAHGKRDAATLIRKKVG